jgi:hypothetical protein
MKIPEPGSPSLFTKPFHLIFMMPISTVFLLAMVRSHPIRYFGECYASGKVACKTSRCGYLRNLV